jgi:cytoskeletal protein RodZ
MPDSSTGGVKGLNGKETDKKSVEPLQSEKQEDFLSLGQRLAGVSSKSAPSDQGSTKYSSESLGEFLRRHREAKGMTIATLSSITKIKDRIIVAVEEDHYDLAPPVPILRGFLKNIASELDLPPEAVLSRYDKMNEEPEPELVLPEWSRKIKVPRRNLRGRISAMVAVALVVCAGLFFYINGWNFDLWQKIQMSGDEAKIPVSPVKPEPVSPEEADQAGQAVSARMESSGAPGEGTRDNQDAPGITGEIEPENGRTPSVAGVFSEPAGESSLEFSLNRAAPPQSDALALKITAKEDTWLRVLVDGNRRDEIFLPRGQSRRWDGQNSFVLTVSNASNAQVELNGVTIRLPQTEGDLVRDLLISKNDLP